MRGHRAAARGLTLMELMVALAIVAVLASLAVPGYGAQMARVHLKSASERLAADLAEARYESARRGQTLHVNFEPGPAWCYTVATTPSCACGSPQPCQLVRVVAGARRDVVLAQASDLRFEPSATALPAAAHAELRSSRGEALRVELTRLGRAKVCAPAGGAPGYAAC
jgi:type IV fimbrial biogenesis protein FimT